MRETTKKHLVVVGVTIAPPCDSAKSPAIRLAKKGGELGVLKLRKPEIESEGEINARSSSCIHFTAVSPYGQLT